MAPDTTPNDQKNVLNGDARTERDRFVAFAFCWADALLVLNEDQDVTFVAGATEAFNVAVDNGADANKCTIWLSASLLFK